MIIRSLPFPNSLSISLQTLLDSALAPRPPYSPTFDNQVNVYLEAEVYHMSHYIWFLTVYQRWFSKHIASVLRPLHRNPIQWGGETHKEHLQALRHLFTHGSFISLPSWPGQWEHQSWRGSRELRHLSATLYLTGDPKHQALDLIQFQMYFRSPLSCFTFVIILSSSKLWQEFILEQIIEMTGESLFFPP